LMQDTNLTVHMVILERGQALVIEKIEPPIPQKVPSWIGMAMDVHSSACGKALIAFLPEAELNPLIQEYRLARHNENSITSAKKLKANLEDVRRAGYSLDDEESEIGLRGIGAPLLDIAGRVIAAISVSGTSGQITPDNVGLLAQKVKSTAAAIS